MFIIPTGKRYKTTTITTALRPARLENAGKPELLEAATRYGWTRRELTVVEIEKMSSGELRYHMLCNPEQYESAFQRQNNIEHNECEMKKVEVQQKWANQKPVTDAEKNHMREVSLQFLRHYPQFIQSETNALAMFEYMRAENLDPTKLESPVAAFEALALAGKLSLNPSAIGAGSETSVTGRDLFQHRNFHLLLQRQHRATAGESMSAEQWKAAHSELIDTRIPELIQQRMAKSETTRKHFQRAADATAHHRGTRFTDFKR